MLSIRQIIEQPILLERISDEQLDEWIEKYPYMSFLYLEKYKRNRTDEQKSKTAFYITHRDSLYKIDYKNTIYPLIENAEKEIITDTQIEKEAETIFSGQLLEEQKTVSEDLIIKEKPITEKEYPETATKQETEKLSLADKILAELEQRKESKFNAQPTDEQEAETAAEAEKTVYQETENLSLADRILAELRFRKESELAVASSAEEQKTTDNSKIEQEEPIAEEQQEEAAQRQESAPDIQDSEDTKQDTNNDLDEKEVDVQSETTEDLEDNIVNQPKSDSSESDKKSSSIANQILSAIQQITTKVITIPMERAIAQIKEDNVVAQPPINIQTEQNKELPVITVDTELRIETVTLPVGENISDLTEAHTYFPDISLEDTQIMTVDINKTENISPVKANIPQTIKIDTLIESNVQKEYKDIVLRKIENFKQDGNLQINIDKIHPAKEKKSKDTEINESRETHTFLEWLNIIDNSYEKNIHRLENVRKQYNYETQFIMNNKKELQQGILEGELDTENEIDESVNKLAEESISFKQEMVTEILAKILVRQEHYEKAIEMYQKLILKFPEKSSTFVAQIEILKKQLQ